MQKTFFESQTLYSPTDRFRAVNVKSMASLMRLSVRSFNLPSPPPRWLSSMSGVGVVEPCLGGWGIWTGSVLSFNMEAFMVKSSPSQADWLGKIKLVYKVLDSQTNCRSMSKKSGQLISPFMEKPIKSSNPAPGQGIWTRFSPMGAGIWANQSSKFQTLGGLPSGDIEALNWSTH